ncbi:hypothetical protein U737_15480 [Methylomonas sp. LW13]|uniref:hypothetical protein n=1 Tax=unclassified Methylomonas TaxID=2608980 RepID=UPI00051BE0B2|nr:MULTISPECIES: hypothetical protein [unclassified Methylomonas]NOV30088.1 hypothetical protein [Methylomonas sp. ZR1]QBC28184.1 hypothetical protein U737_15480 [Methylomonas sp. LW13]
MLGSIAAALVGIWFYNTAARSSRPPISWAVSGVVVYFLAALLWTLAITPSVKDAASHSQSAALIFIVRYAYIGFGVLVAILLNSWLNKSTDSE